MALFLLYNNNHQINDILSLILPFFLKQKEGEIPNFDTHGPIFNLSHREQLAVWLLHIWGPLGVFDQSLADCCDSHHRDRWNQTKACSTYPFHLIQFAEGIYTKLEPLNSYNYFKLVNLINWLHAITIFFPLSTTNFQWINKINGHPTFELVQFFFLGFNIH